MTLLLLTAAWLCLVAICTDVDVGCLVMYGLLKCGAPIEWFSRGG